MLVPMSVCDGHNALPVLSYGVGSDQKTSIASIDSNDGLHYKAVIVAVKEAFLSPLRKRRVNKKFDAVLLKGPARYQSPSVRYQVLVVLQLLTLFLEPVF
jgi:hypothetical protein